MFFMQHRYKISWVVGILTFILLFVGASNLAPYIGLTFYNGSDGEFFLIIIAVIVAYRIKMFVYYGNFKDGIGQHENLQVMVFVMCLGTYALINTIIWELFERELRRNIPPFLYNIFLLGLMVGIGRLGFVFYQNTKFSRENKNQEHYQVCFGAGVTDLEKGLEALKKGDYKTAWQKFDPLAEEGDATAQYNLGLMHYKGNYKVAMNDFQAFMWLEKAAKQGHAEAQYNIGLMYAKGGMESVPQDNIRAYMWFNIATSQGLDGAKRNRDIIAKRMSRADLATAQKRASKCVESDYEKC